MMKLRLSLRNSVKPALLLNLWLALLMYLGGCVKPIEPTYKEENIPYLVKQICKDEYNLDVTTQRTAATLWIYAPLSKILHQDYGIKEDKFFDEEMMDKLRNILTTIGRVLISSDNTPEFFALIASDVNLGLDYTIIGNILDIKKSYAGSIPWTEANRRYVIKFEIVPQAIGDLQGRHLKPYDVKLPDFLAEQISQRIIAQFREEERKKYFEVKESQGKFENDTFIFTYYIEKKSQAPQEIDIRKEILDIIAYCVKTYEFRYFSAVEIIDSSVPDKLTLNKAAIWARPIP